MAGQGNCSYEELPSDGILPGDILVIILCNLPVKSLLRFKSVSKPWYSLISNPRFIELHLHSQAITSNNLILLSDEFLYGLLLSPIRNKNNPPDIDVLILENTPVSPGKLFNWVIDSCNGLVLVCLYSYLSSVPWDLILWNPATRKSRTIQLPEKDFTLSCFTYGLCYVEANNDFKIVGWSNNHCPIDEQPSLCIYSLSSDSWEILNYDVQNFPVVYGPPTFMNGCMNWLLITCSFTYLIAAFDVTYGIMSKYGVPDDCHGDGKILNHTLVIRGCLSIVFLLDDYFEEMESGFEIWVMEEYGVEGSWIKLFTLKQLMLPTISWNDGELVFIDQAIGEDEVSKTLTFYDLFSKKKYSLDFKSFKARQVMNYVESLESVGMAKNLQIERGLEALCFTT